MAACLAHSVHVYKLKVDCTSSPGIWISKSFVVLVFSTRPDAGMPYCCLPHHLVLYQYMHTETPFRYYMMCAAQMISLEELADVLEVVLDQHVDKVVEYFVLNGMEKGVVLSALCESLVKAGVPGGVALKIKTAARNRSNTQTLVGM